MSSVWFRRHCFSLAERCGRCAVCLVAYAAVEQERIEQRQLPGLDSCYGEQFRCGACLSCLRSHKAVQDAEARDAQARSASAGHEEAGDFLPEVTPLPAPEEDVQAMATRAEPPERKDALAGAEAAGFVPGIDRVGVDEPPHKKQRKCVPVSKGAPVSSPCDRSAGDNKTQRPAAPGSHSASL